MSVITHSHIISKCIKFRPVVICTLFKTHVRNKITLPESYNVPPGRTPLIWQRDHERIVVVIIVIVALVLTLYGLSLFPDSHTEYMEYPSVCPNVPSADEIKLVESKLSGFLQYPRAGMTLSVTDLNTLVAHMDCFEPLRKKVVFSQISEDGILPIEASFPVRNMYYNCLAKYELERDDQGKWSTKIVSAAPLASDSSINSTIKRLLSTNFLTELYSNDQLQQYLSKIESVQIKFGEIWINRSPPTFGDENLKQEVNDKPYVR